MTDINETVSTVLRLDAEATPGPWDEDGIYMGLRHLGKHCSDWYYRDSDGNLITVPLERDAAIIAYYRATAPALAREVQRLQAEVCEARIGHDCALVAAYESGLRAGQEAMRERAATLCEDWEEDSYCEGWREMEQGAQHCADAIRALEVSHD